MGEKNSLVIGSCEPLDTGSLPTYASGTFPSPDFFKPVSLVPKYVPKSTRKIRYAHKITRKSDLYKAYLSSRCIDADLEHTATEWYARRLEKDAEEKRNKAKRLDDEFERTSREAACFVMPIYASMFSDIGLPRHDLEYLRRRIQNEGWSFISVTLPALEKALIKGLSTSRFTPISDFVCARGSRLPRFLGQLWTEIFTIDGFLKDEACPVAIQCLRQILGFGYKVKIPYNSHSEGKAIDNFIATENTLASNIESVDWDNDPVLRLASLLVADVFRDYRRDSLSFRHGPGVTADVPVDMKFDAKLKPAPVMAVFGDSFFLNERHQESASSRQLAHTHTSLFREGLSAEVKLVPKDSRGPRIISAEPFQNQWAQQGIRGFMYERLESHDFTRGYVNFSSQEVNRTLAQQASLTREYSTLDLKEASDRVSLRLVETLFELCPDLLCDFVATRSPRTKVPGFGELTLTKFAPMGSALCFPVLSSAVYFILLSGIIGLTQSVSEAVGSVYVYGDDVIVRTEYADFCVSLLERYLLLVNRDKSFINSPFCESCGLDAFRGNDTTSIKLRVCPTTRNKKTKIRQLLPQEAESLVETANLLSTLGYEKTAETLFRFVESCLKSGLPYGYRHSPFLCRWYSTSKGTSAWTSTVEKKLKSKVTFNKVTGRRELCVKTVSVSASRLSYEKWLELVENGDIHLPTEETHLMRILPMLGSGRVLPMPGEYHTDAESTYMWTYVGPDGFIASPSNKWLPCPRLIVQPEVELPKGNCDFFISYAGDDKSNYVRCSDLPFGRRDKPPVKRNPDAVQRYWANRFVRSPLGAHAYDWWFHS